MTLTTTSECSCAGHVTRTLVAEQHIISIIETRDGDQQQRGQARPLHGHRLLAGRRARAGRQHHGVRHRGPERRPGRPRVQHAGRAHQPHHQARPGRRGRQVRGGAVAQGEEVAAAGVGPVGAAHPLHHHGHHPPGARRGGRPAGGRWPAVCRGVCHRVGRSHDSHPQH